MQCQLLYHEQPSRQLLIQPITTGSKKPSFVLLFEKLVGSNSASNTQINCTAKFLPSNTVDPSQFKPLISTPIYGCLGLIQVNNDPFVCVITDCTPVGEIEGSAIYCVNNVMFFSLTSNKYDDITDNGQSFVQQRDSPVPYNSSYGFAGDFATSEQQFETVRHPCQHMQRFLSSGSFYFSYNFDLTRSAQRRHQSEYGGLWDLNDDRFFWNQNMIRELLKFRKQLPEYERTSFDAEGILVMSISGFVRIEDIQLLRDRIKCAIISRLSCRRAGTRFNTRGIDDDGNVANNVETELLVYHDGMCYSYLIIRGSVPLFWEQQGIQLGSHKIQISRSAAATQPAFEKHLNDMLNEYGRIHIVNLLGQREGAESLLSDAFAQHVSNLESPNVRMTNFDFHAAVKGNQFDNLSLLINQLREAIKSTSFFLINTKTSKVITSQQGVFRVNCLDCLDRTNVVEGLICKANLQIFLQSIKSSADTLYNSCLNDMWADNGDELSRIYTGTGALKSGFTRTGKRTLAGFMDDARKSAARFYMNNFQDKAKQEMIDHLLGKLPNQPQIRLFNPVREAVKKALDGRAAEFSSSKNIRIHIATWNVNGKQPLGENLIPWLTFARSQSDRPEMFVIGFQEIVELSPQQMMATDMTKRLVWEDLILKTLNSTTGNNQYVIVKSGQLVGAALIVILRSDCVNNIRSVQGAIKKTGLAGLAGNKGGVAIRMEYSDTTICFVCAHLAAGHSNVVDRNTDYKTINEGLLFEKGLRIESHDVIFWLGDFNYRIDFDNEAVRQMAANKRIEELLSRDQLLNEMRAGRVFQGFSESRITFQPTYKYDAGTNNYDSSEKNRIPAWTDRILFSGQGIEIMSYERSELVSSDHKPVKALAKIEVKVINKEIQERIQKQLYLQYSNQSTTIHSITPSPNPIMKPLISGGNVETSTKVGKLIDFDSEPPQLPPRPINPFEAPTTKNNPFIEDPFADPWTQL